MQTKTSLRKSNMELLRIISMLFVLGLHANFLALHSPTQVDVVANPWNAFSRFLFEGLCIIAVNAFVFISGWFGIRVSVKSFFKLVFQCLFIGLVITIGYCVATHSFASINMDILLLRTDNLWFIYAYIGLYLLAPILNRFIEHSPRQEHFQVVITFFILQTYIAWYRGFVNWYSNGYSTLSFIGLYLLAQYIRKYPVMYKELSVVSHFAIVVLCTLFIGIFATVMTSIYRTDYAHLMYSYLNPIVILSALSITIAFSKINFQSQLVNWFACSSLAAYIVHSHPCMFSLYKNIARQIYDSHSGFNYWILILGYICSVFSISVFIDKIRILAWNKLQTLFFRS